MLFDIIKTYRPLLLQLRKLATKDQNLKKKRIWRRDKDNTAALDDITRQLNVRTQTIELYLSTQSISPLQLTTLETSKGESLYASHTSQELGSRNEVDEQWSVLRRKLVEDGITDIDIEAHMSTIRSLLQDKLPSYYDTQPSPSLEEGHGSVTPSTGLRAVMPRSDSEPNRLGPSPFDNDEERDFGQSGRPSVRTLSSPGLRSPGDRQMNGGSFQTKYGRRRLSHSADPASALETSQGEAKIQPVLHSDAANTRKQCFISEIGNCYFASSV